MDKHDIISSIENIQHLQHLSLEELKNITELYPFFLSGRLLYLKKLHTEGNFEFESQLKYASAQALNRKRIYELIFQQQIQESIEQIETDLSDKSILSVEEQEENTIISSPQEQAQHPPSLAEEEVQDEIPSIPLTQLSTISNFKKTQAPLKKKSDPEITSPSKEERDELEKEILQYAISYSIEKEVMDDIEEQQNEIKDQVEKETASENSTTTDETERHTFNDWLKILDESTQRKTQEEKVSSSELIDNFIKKNPQISKPTKDEKEIFTPSNLSKLSVVDNKDFVTETLAKIYAKQGNVPKAIQAYEKLILKFPEKKTYFADQIRKLKNNKEE